MKSEFEQMVMDEASLKTRRRFLLGAAGGAGAALGGFGFSLSGIAAAADMGTKASTPVPNDYRAMVCFFLFGGNDAANTIIPYDQTTYNQYIVAREGSLSRPLGITRLRPDLLPISAASINDGRQLAFPKEMSSLKRLYDKGKAAVMTNVGVLAQPTSKAQYNTDGFELPPQLFSHSDHQRFWQLGVPNYTTRTGWAGRMGDLLAAGNNSNVSMCISVAGNNTWQVGGTVLPYPINSEYGAPQFWSSWNTNRMTAMNAMNLQTRTNLLEKQAARVYNRAINAQIDMDEALNYSLTLEGFFPKNPVGFNPGLNGDYNDVMQQFQMVARLIAAREVLGHKRQIFFVSLGGFDNHDSLAEHPDRLKIISDAMASFYQATVALGVDQNVTTFTASDFGRPLKSNGTGADHGWGAHHFVVGGSVRGGNVYGKFPQMIINGPDALDNQGHLLPSTSVDEYAATLASWFGVSQTDIPTVIPNIGRFAKPDLGFMNGIKPYPQGHSTCVSNKPCKPIGKT
ncbi:MAG TPA: DUF1501 domain-containing protein [Arenimonas sp.]|jgi:uncharacterized protein (DUF1501 family)|nr:DUF1501 domain-containing protein [Arenimonas sp.]